MVLSELIPLSTYIPNSYLRAFIVLLVAIVLLQVVFTIIRKIILKVSTKTKTDIDDIIVSRSTTPITIIAVLIGVRIALEELALSASLELNINLTIYSALAIVISYLIYVIIDSAAFHALKKVSEKSKVQVNDTLASLIKAVLKVTLIAIAALYVLDLWGIEILPLIGALGIAGLAVALALQPTLSNIFSGVSMVMDKSVRVGDWLVLESGTWGVVEKVGIRSTKIRSFDNQLLVIPNSKLSDSTINNVALPEPKTRVVVPFSVAYGSNIQKVKKIVMKEIEKVPNFVKEPEPSVKFLEMADSSLNFKAFFYVDSYENSYSALDEANTRIYDALNKAGVSIPFPQMDVHLKDEKRKR